MIYGIGTDLIDIARIGVAYDRHRQRFADRLLSLPEQQELALATDKARFLAKRWAAKEAFAKALGTGIRPPVTLAGIWITHDAAGRPGLGFDEAIAGLLQQRGIGRAHLSLSDERGSVVAFVVLEVS
ncbi:holo-ACP synthase [Chitinimonas viridis]|uniref:Holo-[acyl-carrier-protein] synthase n=1 Tax=Chitinimonas viridis TaxID=664880 RepID=A0ABT8B2U6_9NEIS|nr:holo-ACP synthase [Chitinimonas viridis]MBL8509460.1 holo-ACP synthase [Chitinimonas sp.]MDN3576162.1 holo-ACP synthase [Chitinimonas viridis]